MIATEAAAEGINLQFCSLVVNYDLPWNPQRIEQRIGRCHRYGQKHDVVVVNFLNRTNEADQRVFQLLSEKFKLFEGVFGASDEVLGAIESGIDFEKRINDIYQTCRRPDEIGAAFQQLQMALSTEINEQMDLTRRKLLENFDDEVREKLRVQQEASQAALDRFERMLMSITRHGLDGAAEFLDEASFRLTRSPFGPDIPLGLYELPRRRDDAHIYRLTHPLADAVIARAKGRDLPPAEVCFSLSGHPGKISILEPLIGHGGSWLPRSTPSRRSIRRRSTSSWRRSATTAMPLTMKPSAASWSCPRAPSVTCLSLRAAPLTNSPSAAARLSRRRLKGGIWRLSNPKPRSSTLGLRI